MKIINFILKLKIILFSLLWSISFLSFTQVQNPYQERFEKAKQNLREVIPTLPFFAQSNMEGKAIGDPLKFNYGNMKANGSVNFSEPARIDFNTSWEIELFSRTRSEEVMRQEYDNNVLFAVGKNNLRVGAMGNNSCVGSDANPGTWDPNVSGDPYEGTGRVFVVLPCATITVRAGISIYASGAHGARVKPDVIEACRAAGEKWALEIAQIFITSLQNYSCNIIDQNNNNNNPADENCQLSIRSDCASLELIPGEVSKICNFYVKGWNYSDKRVFLTLPQVTDNWGSVPGGIVVVNDGSAWPPNMNRPEHGFALYFSARITAQPQQLPLQVHVSQEGCKSASMVLPITVKQKGSAGLINPVYMQNIFYLGLYLGYAEYVAYKRGDVNYISDNVNSARQYAISIGLATDGFDDVLNEIQKYPASGLLYSKISVTRENTGRFISKNCNCGGVLTNPWYAYMLGYQLGFAEVHSWQNGDKYYLINNVLEPARLNASNCGFPIVSFDILLKNLRRRMTVNQAYSSVVSIRNNMAEYANRWCQW